MFSHGYKRFLVMGIRHPSFLPSLPAQQISCIHPQMKVPLWELWDPASYPKEPRRSLAHCTLGNRQADLGTGCRSWSDLWTGSSPSWLQSGSPRRTLSQTVPHRWESLLGSPGFQRRWYSITLEQKQQYQHKFGHAGEGERSTLTSPVSPLPHGNTA